METNKQHNKRSKRTILLFVCLVVTIVLLVAGYYKFYYAKNLLNQKCIASAEDAEMKIKQFPEARDFIKSFDKKSGQIEIKATLDYFIDDNPDSGIVMVGTSLLNGGFKKFNSYRFRFGCDLDFRKEEEATEGQEYLRFTYKINGEEKIYTDESRRCLDYAIPEATYYDFNKDGNNEALVQCYYGSGSVKKGFYHIGGSNLLIYSVKESGLSMLRELSNEKYEWKVQDFNGDGFLDIRVGEYFDCESGEKNKLCQEGGSWAIIPKTYIWDKQKNEFVEPKIGEE